MTPNDPHSRANRILVVDDESFVREAIELYLLTEGFEVLSAGSGHDALQLLEKGEVDLAILDIMMPGMSGIELLGEIKSRHPDTEVVMASGCGTLETAVEAMRMGAYDYVPKPILNFQEDLLKVVHKALERRRLLSLNRKLSADVQVVNRELKTANSTLKKKLAAFDLLYDSGRMLAEVGSRDEVLSFARQVLQYQLGISAAVLVVRKGDSFHKSLTLGLEPEPDPGPLAAEKLEDWISNESEQGPLPAEIVGRLADWLEREIPRDLGPWTSTLIRSAGTSVGVLFTGSREEFDPQLLELFAHQLATPLTHQGEEMTR